MSFLDQLQAQTNQTETQNGALAFESTSNACLDFFALGAAKRTNLDQARELFERAYAQDPLKAVKILFYIRDIRGGCGERDIFRACIKDNPKLLAQIAQYIPVYGRWDDMLVDGYDNPTVVSMVMNQLNEDQLSKCPSLLAKWMPSVNTSSAKTVALAYKWCEALGIDRKMYQSLISKIRAKIKLLEQQMSSGKWHEIEYQKLPSQAFMRHTAAFERHDSKRYENFLEKVKKGEAKINTSTIFCYEAFDLAMRGEDEAASIIWENLPEYCAEDALVVADVSGSMIGRPMSISVSLALYFAEMNKGVFHNKFLTFSAKPRLVEIQGETLTQKFNSIQRSDWGMNTNIDAVYDTILQAAVDSHAAQDELPKVIYIISDMEFDQCVDSSKTPYEHAKAKYEAAGYQLPTIVFWNCNSVQNQLPALNKKGVVLVSGASQSTFQIAVGSKSPEEVMDEVVNSERYSTITLEKA